MGEWKASKQGDVCTHVGMGEILLQTEGFATKLHQYPLHYQPVNK